MDRPGSREEVRRLVERELRREVRDTCWEYMVQRGLVDDVVNDVDWQEPLSYLIEQYRQCEELVRRALSEQPGRGREGREVRAKPENDRRWEALSLLFRRKAGSQKGIRSFWETIGAPIASPVEWLDRSRSGLDGVIQRIVKGVKQAELVEERVFQDEDEAAREFEELVGAIKERYGLDTVEAYLFLTQAVWPKEIAPGRARIKYHPRFPCLDRLVLEVDPALREDEVLRLYREVRRRYWRDMYRENSGAKRVTDKDYELLRFVLEEGEGLTWRERMEKWNERYPPEHPWHFSYETNMARDFHRLIRRLVGMPYDKFVQVKPVRPVPSSEKD